MISCPTVSKSVIRTHYDLSTLFYRLLWGPHIHHGLWDRDESPSQAQLQLTETLARDAGIFPDARVLDVGCGMGGSSIHLARELNCDVTGITISRFQRLWAACSATWHGVSSRTRFQWQDAEQVQFTPEQFDFLWSVECTEHLFDKAAFFRRATTWLRPGGRVAICAWLAGDTDGNAALQRQVFDVCEGFFCPSLGTRDDYVSWFQQAGLVVEKVQDWTPRVTRTWEICRDRVNRTGVRWIARMLDRDQVMFLDRFDTILNAYRSGAMQYGCFIARKTDTRGSSLG